MVGDLTVRLDRGELEIDPGGAMSGEAIVGNGSTEPCRARLAVTGPAAAWAFVVPPEVAIDVGAEASVRFGFRVPFGHRPPAGPLDFEVRAEPVPGPGGGVTAHGVLHVRPFRRLGLLLGPGRAGGDGSVEHRITVVNDGNTAVAVAVGVTSADRRLAVEIEPAAVVAAPGAREAGTVRVRPPEATGRGRPALGFVVSATPDEGEAVTVEGALEPVPGVRRRGPATAAVVVAVVLAAVLMRLTVLAPGDEERAAPAAGPIEEPGNEDPNCPGAGHANLSITGLMPDQIPLLPPDYAFFNMHDDGCTPVRWNPCEPVHFVINPELAPPTGVADVRDAFARMGASIGIDFVDDGMTDEEGTRGRALYQPERYGDRWAPILVYWRTGAQRTDDIEIVGGGFPSRVGDVYVSGVLFLSVDAVTNPTTGAALEGGFGPDPGGFGPIGPGGVTWGRVILHEIGHMMGLGHVSDPAQLMYPETTDHTTRPTMFSAGDRAGLRRIGADAGCLPTPTPGPTEPTRR